AGPGSAEGLAERDRSLSAGAKRHPRVPQLLDLPEPGRPGAHVADEGEHVVVRGRALEPVEHVAQAGPAPAQEAGQRIVGHELRQRLVQVDLDDRACRQMPAPEEPRAGPQHGHPDDHGADGGQDASDHPSHTVSPSQSATRTPGAVRSSTAQVAPAARSASVAQPPVATPSVAAPMATAAATLSGVSPTTTTRQRSGASPSRAAPRAAPMRSSSVRSSWSLPKPPKAKYAASPARSSLRRAPSRRLPVPRPTATWRRAASWSRIDVTPACTVKPDVRASSSPSRPT